jgi:hypothetical protein
MLFDLVVSVCSLFMLFFSDETSNTLMPAIKKSLEGQNK